MAPVRLTSWLFGACLTTRPEGTVPTEELRFRNGAIRLERRGSAIRMTVTTTMTELTLEEAWELAEALDRLATRAR